MRENLIEIGTIVEDHSTSAIYEITGLIYNQDGWNVEIQYSVNILYNPLKVKTDRIAIVNRDQLTLSYFYNVELSSDSEGHTLFELSTMYDYDAVELIKNKYFLKNYFNRIRKYRKNKTVWTIVSISRKRLKVKMYKEPNIIESLLFGKKLRWKVISLLDLFTNYIVVPDKSL
jgi:hypothetical protein